MFTLKKAILIIITALLASCGGGSVTPTPTPNVLGSITGYVVSTFADNTSSNSMGRRSLAIDSSGNLYVGDLPNNLILKITAAGVITTFAGSGTPGSTNGTGVAASFNSPQGVAVDANGNVYVADSGNNLIRRITPAGVVTTFAGSGARGNANGVGTDASFWHPIGVAVDANGNVYVAEDYNTLIRKITPAGEVTTLAGSGLRDKTNGTGTAASFYNPIGVAVGANGNVYVGDTMNNLIRKITPAGVVTTLAGSGTAGNTNGIGAAASFNTPEGVAVDENDNVYVADTGNNLIRKITPTGTVTTLAGSGLNSYINGDAMTAAFNVPFSIAVATNGDVYVTDFSHAVRKLAAQR